MFDWFRRKQAPPARKMTSADLADLLRCGSLSSAGAPVTPERAMRVATVYACVRILAESVAQLPCKIYRRDETGREQVESGPLFDLMHFPNPWQNSFEFREHLMACLCLRGNFFALMSRRRGEVIELLPLRPEAVSVQRRNWELLYTYTDANGRSATVGADKMLHVRGLSLDGIMGVSPIRYGRDAIGLAMATEKHGALMFRNGARPGGVLKHPAKLSDEALEHLKISWEAAHGGDNAGRTAILEEGMSYESVSMTNEDAQYLDTRQFQRNEICALFRVPPHMVGDLTKSSFSNITQQSLEFVKYSVLPWCRRIETAFWRSLLTDEQRREGYRVEFLVDGLERADIKTRYESYSIAIQNGILSPNECRRLENRNPREGGDVFLQPLNMTDGRQAGDADENEEEKKENAVEKTAAYLSGQFGEDLKALAKSAAEEMKAAAAALKAATPGSLMAPDAGAAQAEGTRSGLPGDASRARMASIIGALAEQAFLHQDEIDRIMAAGKAQAVKADDAEDEDDEPEHDDWASGEWNEESADLNRIMRDFRPKLERMYREIVAKEVAEIRKLVDRHFPEGEKRVKSAEDEFLTALQLFYGRQRPGLANRLHPLYAELAVITASMAAKQCGVSKRKLLSDLQKTVGEYTAIEAERHSVASIGELRKLIMGSDDPRTLMQERIAEWEKKRHVKLSRRDAVYGPNWYAREAYKRAGITKIRWVTNGGKTCPFCAELGGKVVGIEKDFISKGEAMSGRAGKPHTFKRGKKQPPIHRGCVCALVPAIVDASVPEALRASIADCAEAASLFDLGREKEAMRLGGGALKDLLNASGLLKEGYKIEGVGFTLSERNADAYMETLVREGKINLSTKPFPVTGSQTDWRPAQGVLNALKKIHDGTPLTFMDEASLEGVYHEIQHTRQNFAGGLPDAKKPLMETVNEWTSRRNYHEFLKKLGRESILTSDRMKDKGFGQADWVKNFDALLEHLDIKDNQLLDKLTRINSTKSVGSFDEEVSTLLGGMTKVDSERIKKALQDVGIDNKTFIKRHLQ